MNLLRAMLLMFMAIPLAACALSGEAIEGRVLEEGTNKPIPGAIVVVRWQGRVSSFVDSHGVCYHVESATADEQGRYQTKPWRKTREYGVSFDHIDVDAYKPGYGFPDQLSQVMEIEYLAPFNGTREERLAYFVKMLSATSCPSAGSSSQNLYPLYKAMHQEAKLISVTNEDSKTVKVLRQEAAEVAVRPDGHITSEEMEKRVNEFLRNNMQ